MLSVIIPAYNEEKRLPEALNKIIHYLKEKKKRQKDRTTKVLKDYIWGYFNTIKLKG